MAGSYNHVINRAGNLADPDSSGIENLGDAFEAIEEMYGMIWYLAHNKANFDDPVKRVEEARQNYTAGLDLATRTKNKRR